MMQENDQDTDDKYLSDLYSELSQEQPSHTLDEKILSEARKDVEQQTTGAGKGSTGASPDYSFRKKSSGPFSGNWAVPASLAAVILLSATVVVMIEKDRPYSLTSPPENFTPERAFKESDSKPALKPVPEEIVGNQEKHVEKKKAKLQAEPVVREQEIMALQQAVKPEQQARAKTKMAEPSDKPKTDTAQLQRMTAPEADQVTREDVASAGAQQKSESEQENLVLVTPKLARKNVSAKSPQPAKTESLPTSSAPASANEITEDTPALAEETEESMISAEPAEEVNQPESSLLAKSSDKDQSEIADAKQESIASTASSPAAPAEISAMKAVPMKRFSTAASDNLVAESKVQDRCPALSIDDCLKSKECTLGLNSENGSYQCRAAQNECEQQFSQADDTQEMCESRPGCKFQVANCFCPPDVECVCGGGTPAMCIPN